LPRFVLGKFHYTKYQTVHPIAFVNDGVAVFFSTHIISDIEKCADDIVYISNGKIVASLTKEAFIDEFSADGETLEETMLRMERGGKNA